MVVLLVSTTIFSQTTTDSVINPSQIKSLVIQKVDTAQILRIDNIEKSLSAFYTYNRRSQNLLILSMGMSIVSVLLVNDNDNTIPGIISLTGGVVGIIGTVIYLDSYKFLKFKPKRKEISNMTYY